MGPLRLWRCKLDWEVQKAARPGGCQGLDERVHSSMRYDDFRKRLVDAVLQARAETPEALRRAVLERARETPGAKGNLPQSLTHYVDSVARHAYKVTDAEVAALQRAGQSDDSLFEITVAAAVGAALHRLDRGMAALRGQEPD